MTGSYSRVIYFLTCKEAGSKKKGLIICQGFSHLWQYEDEKAWFLLLGIYKSHHTRKIEAWAVDLVSVCHQPITLCWQAHVIIINEHMVYRELLNKSLLFKRNICVSNQWCIFLIKINIISVYLHMISLAYILCNLMSFCFLALFANMAIFWPEVSLLC